MSAVGIATRGIICKGGGSGGTIIAWDHTISLDDSLVEIRLDNTELNAEITPMLEVSIVDNVSVDVIVTAGEIITGGLATEGFGTSTFGSTDSEKETTYSHEFDIKINS